MKIKTCEIKQFRNKLLHWNLVKTREVRYIIISVIIFTMFLDLVKEAFWILDMENTLDGTDWFIEEPK